MIRLVVLTSILIVIVSLPGCSEEKTNDVNNNNIEYLENSLISMANGLDTNEIGRRDFIHETLEMYRDKRYKKKVLGDMDRKDFRDRYEFAYQKLMTTPPYEQQLYWCNELLKWELINKRYKNVIRRKTINPTMPVIKVFPENHEFRTGDTLEAFMFYTMPVGRKDFIRIDHPVAEGEDSILRRVSPCSPYGFEYQKILDHKGMNTLRFTGFIHYLDTFSRVPMELNIDVK